MEIWKQIPNLSGYEASSSGNIRSLKRKTPYVMVGGIDNGGYRIVTIRGDKSQVTKLVHRLVAITFLKNPDNKKTVNHINGVKLDNRIENLEWNTYSENINHAFKYGLNVSKRGVPVVQLDLNDNIIAKFPSLLAASKATKVFSGNICMCVNGHYKQSNGFKFKKADV